MLLYWSIGRTILAEQERLAWGDDVVGCWPRICAPRPTSGHGFSRRNLFYMRRFATLWPEVGKVQSVIAQIGWTHHIQLLDAFASDADLYAWYVAQTVAHHWSVRELKGQIDLKFHLRVGAATTNFAEALGPAEGGAALAVTKDPYVLDFIDLAEDVKERQLEDALVSEIPRFLRELGVGGFAYYGRQQPLLVGGQEFFLDLLFYHHRLRRFVVIDLFEAEFAGKMGLYLNAVDEQLREGDDRESIGLILCTSHNATVAKFALHRSGAPIGVANWQTEPQVDISDELPRELSAELGNLPEIRDRLTSHVATTAERVEARLAGNADESERDRA